MRRDGTAAENFSGERRYAEKQRAASAGRARNMRRPRHGIQFQIFEKEKPRGRGRLRRVLEFQQIRALYIDFTFTR